MRRTPRFSTIRTLRSACGTVEVEAHEGRTVVRFTGDLDASMREQFPAVLADVAGGTHELRVDLRAVEFCGAEGVAVLQRLRDARPGAAFTVEASPAVERTLRLCDPSLLGEAAPAEPQRVPVSY
jgi:anti-anti-sigma factor